MHCKKVLAFLFVWIVRIAFLVALVNCFVTSFISLWETPENRYYMGLFLWVPISSITLVLLYGTCIEYLKEEKQK